jgi:hypothetical protein
MEVKNMRLKELFEREMWEGLRSQLSDLSPEQLVILIAKTKEVLYPEAVIVGEELECSKCHKHGTPTLVEDGMTVTHDLFTLSAERIVASGWDGGSSYVSDEGDLLVLQCGHCSQMHRIPDNVVFEWY